MEEFWDFLCSELGILQNAKKKDIVREYGRRIRKETVREIEKHMATASGGGSWRRVLVQTIDRLKNL